MKTWDFPLLYCILHTKAGIIVLSVTVFLLSTSGLRRIVTSWPIPADGCSAHEVDDGTNFEVSEVNCLLEAFLLRQMGVCAKKELAELKL